ncbi:MAG: SAM-dependent methyltransferase, partial [Bdellovibrionales bacterium]|nr:SAM-dependent methyltransferase [Bdellovibrionales bacterium]
MTNMIKENLLVINQFLKEFKTTGEICPSSRWAAEALTYPMREANKALRILEVGPGTGTVTKKILKEMKNNDTLLISEINPSFMKVLKDRIKNDQNYLKNKDRIKFSLGPVQEIDHSEHFDIIVCAIPFLNLDVKTIESIFVTLKKLSTPETIMTYYEYKAMKSISKVIPPKSRQDRIKSIERFFDSN